MKVYELGKQKRLVLDKTTDEDGAVMLDIVFRDDEIGKFAAINLYPEEAFLIASKVLLAATALRLGKEIGDEEGGR